VKSEFLALKGYYIVVVLTIHASYTIINIYAPNSMKKRNTFFKQVDRFINEYSIGQIILAGDYNDILSKIESEFLALKGYYIVVVLTILLIFVFFQIVEVHLY
jgi:exonuclease III